MKKSPIKSAERTPEQSSGEKIHLSSDVTITFVDQEFAYPNEPGEIPEKVKRLLKEDTFNIVIPEYFAPAIDDEFDNIPFVLKIIDKLNLWENSSDLGMRILMSRKISNILALENKKVAVVDFGNNPYWYSLSAGLQIESPIITGVIAGLIIGNTLGLDKIHQVALLTSGGAAGTMPIILDYVINRLGLGHYSPSKVAKYEKTFLHIEDARRILIARNLYNFAKDNSEGTKQNILYIIPKEHRIRISKMLKEWDTAPYFRAKARLYQTLIMGIPNKIEFWENENRKWQKTTENK